MGHVGNFVGDLFTGQGLIGGFFGQVYPELAAIPTSRHEAACASGSIAILSAMRDIEAGHYDVACVLGLELMRNVDGKTGAEYLGAARWLGHEANSRTSPGRTCSTASPASTTSATVSAASTSTASPRSTSAMPKHNPNAQTRGWNFPEGCFSNDDELNPVIDGAVRKMDCGQITDGAACVVLASEKAAKEHAAKLGLKLQDIPRIKGWGHHSAPILLETKLQLYRNHDLIFPHAKATLDDAMATCWLANN